MSTKSRSINDTSAMGTTDISSKLTEKKSIQLSTPKQNIITMLKSTQEVHGLPYPKDLFQIFCLQTFFESIKSNHFLLRLFNLFISNLQFTNFLGIYYLNRRNFRAEKFSRVSRILPKFAKLNPREIFANSQIAKLNPREIFWKLYQNREN